MAREIVECIPNFSEGRRKDVVDGIAGAIRSVSGVRVLDVETDANHNRAVITFIGDRTAVAEAAFRGARVAVERIDLTVHRGEHPRIGALDVCPFVPISGVTMEDCVLFAIRTSLVPRFTLNAMRWARAPTTVAPAPRSTPRRGPPSSAPEPTSSRST